MFVTFPFQLDLLIFVKRVAKYNKCFADVKKYLACCACLLSLLYGIYCEANKIYNYNAA